MDLELGTDPASMRRLLTFLTMTFNGGTDVDAPLALSLERVGREGWNLVRPARGPGWGGGASDTVLVHALVSQVGRARRRLID